MARRLAILLLLGLASCVGSAVPQPPNVQPVDPGQVFYRTEEDAGNVVLQARPGAIEPETSVWFWNLETADPPVVTQSESDGSFLAIVPAAMPTVELRVQARSGDEHSPPVDLVAGIASSTPVVRPACFVIVSELVFDGRAAELTLDNECTTDAVLGETRLRATTAFIIDRPTELRIPTGARAVLRLSAPGLEPVEDILFVTIDLGGELVRYPVTLIAR